MIERSKKTNKSADLVLGQEIQSLLLVEKIFADVPFVVLTSELDVIKLRLKNVHMLMSAYFKAGDFDRVIRFLSQNTNSNLYIKDLINKLCQEPKLTDLDLQNYVLYILQLLGDSMLARN